MVPRSCRSLVICVVLCIGIKCDSLGGTESNNSSPGLAVSSSLIPAIDYSPTRSLKNAKISIDDFQDTSGDDLGVSPPDDELPKVRSTRAPLGVDFVPTKLYAQVRRSHTVKRLTREDALRSASNEEEILAAPRLREVITKSKANTVYTEKGYEDAAYDHGGHTRDADFREGYAVNAGEEDEDESRNEELLDSPRQFADPKSITENEIARLEEDLEREYEESERTGRDDEDDEEENSSEREFPNNSSLPESDQRVPASPAISMDYDTTAHTKAVHPTAAQLYDSWKRLDRDVDSDERTDSLDISGSEENSQEPVTINVQNSSTLVTPKKLPYMIIMRPSERNRQCESSSTSDRRTIDQSTRHDFTTERRVNVPRITYAPADSYAGLAQSSREIGRPAHGARYTERYEPETFNSDIVRPGSYVSRARGKKSPHPSTRLVPPPIPNGNKYKKLLKARVAGKVMTRFRPSLKEMILQRRKRSQSSLISTKTRRGKKSRGRKNSSSLSVRSVEPDVVRSVTSTVDEKLLLQAPAIVDRVVNDEIESRFKSDEFRDSGEAPVVEIQVPELNFEVIDEGQDNAIAAKSPVNKTFIDTDKYPFYDDPNVSPALKYATNPLRVPKKSHGGTEFYDSRDEYRECDDVRAELKTAENGEYEQRRLRGLGDSLDCFRAKYFDQDPLDNPLFAEELVDEPGVPEELDPRKLNARISDHREEEHRERRISRRPEIIVEIPHGEGKRKRSRKTGGPGLKLYQRHVYEDVMGTIKNLAGMYGTVDQPVVSSIPRDQFAFRLRHYRLQPYRTSRVSYNIRPRKESTPGEEATKLGYFRTVTVHKRSVDQDENSDIEIPDPMRTKVTYTIRDRIRHSRPRVNDNGEKSSRLEASGSNEGREIPENLDQPKPRETPVTDHRVAETFPDDDSSEPSSVSRDEDQPTKATKFSSDESQGDDVESQSQEDQSREAHSYRPVDSENSFERFASRPYSPFESHDDPNYRELGPRISKPFFHHPSFSSLHWKSTSHQPSSRYSFPWEDTLEEKGRDERHEYPWEMRMRDGRERAKEREMQRRLYGFHEDEDTSETRSDFLYPWERRSSNSRRAGARFDNEETGTVIRPRFSSRYRTDTLTDEDSKDSPGVLQTGSRETIVSAVRSMKALNATTTPYPMASKIRRGSIRRKISSTTARPVLRMRRKNAINATSVRPTAEPTISNKTKRPARPSYRIRKPEQSAKLQLPINTMMKSTPAPKAKSIEHRSRFSKERTVTRTLYPLPNVNVRSSDDDHTGNRETSSSNPIERVREVSIMSEETPDRVFRAEKINDNGVTDTFIIVRANNGTNSSLITAAGLDNDTLEFDPKEDSFSLQAPLIVNLLTRVPPYTNHSTMKPAEEQNYSETKLERAPLTDYAKHPEQRLYYYIENF